MDGMSGNLIPYDSSRVSAVTLTRLIEAARKERERIAMTPSIGRTVHYLLTAADAQAVSRRRTNGASIAERMKADPPAWPAGAQAHIGNPVSEGTTVPMVITAVWPNEFGEGVPGVNGQAFLDGNDALWVTSAKEGTEPGTWAWPPRA